MNVFIYHSTKFIPYSDQSMYRQHVGVLMVNFWYFLLLKKKIYIISDFVNL